MKTYSILIAILMSIGMFINSQEVVAGTVSSESSLMKYPSHHYNQNVSNPIKDYAPWITAILIAVGSSIVTWAISRAQMRTTKENILLQVNASNISTKRQEWIDNLRKNISEIIKNHFLLVSIITTGKETRYIHQLEEFQKIIGLITLVDLSLNPNEIDSKNLMIMLKEYTQHYDFKSPETDIKIQKIIDLTQRILKAEWNRVKRSE